MEFSIAPDEDPADKIYKGLIRDISDSRLEEALEHSGYKYDGTAHYIVDNFVDVRRTVVGNRVQIYAQLKGDQIEEPNREAESKAEEGKPFDSASPVQIHAEVKEEPQEESDEKPLAFAIPAVPLTVVPPEQPRDVAMESKEELEAAEILAGGIRTVKPEPIETEMAAVKEEPELMAAVKEEPELMATEAAAPAVEEQPVEAEAATKTEEPVHMEAGETAAKDEATGAAETATKTEEPVPMEAEKTAAKAEAAGAADKAAKEKTKPMEPEVIVIEEKADGGEKKRSAPKISEKPAQRIIDGRVVEDGDFPEERGYYLVGRTMVTAVSTSKGRKLADNEIVYFKYSKSSSKYNAQWIVRFSTKRSGEVGRLPMEWGKCVVPLVSSGKVKVLGRCVAAPPTLHMMQEVFLYVSFYVHRSVFIALESSTWTLESSTYIDASVHPLLSLFNLLELKPYQKAEFTPSELDSRKRGLKLQDDTDEAAAALQLVKKRKGGAEFRFLNKTRTNKPSASQL